MTNRPALQSAPGTHRNPELPVFELPRLQRPEDGERRTTWLEFFFDLVFVVAVDQVARRLYGEVTAASVVGYAALYVPVWWAWVGYVIYTDRFGVDDLGDRLLTLLQMAAVTVLAVRAHDALEGGSAGFALAYGAFRLVLALRYALAAWGVREARGLALRQSIGFALAAALWLASAAVPVPARYFLWGAGFLVDVASPFAAWHFHATVPPDTAHMEERFGTFINIVLGEGFVGLVEGMRDLRWESSAGMTAWLALVLGFALWWVYFETLDGAPMEVLRREGRSGPYKVWVYAHLPLAAGIAAAGVGVGSAVHHAVRPELGGGERWLLAGAIAVCFASLAAINLAYAASGGGRASRAIAWRKAGTAVAALAVGAFGAHRPAITVMGSLALLGALQVAIDVHQRARARQRARR